jgi:hypothetical protein
MRGGFFISSYSRVFFFAAQKAQSLLDKTRIFWKVLLFDRGWDMKYNKGSFHTLWAVSKACR